MTVVLQGYFSTSTSTLVLVAAKILRLKVEFLMFARNVQVNVYGSLCCKKMGNSFRKRSE